METKIAQPKKPCLHPQHQPATMKYREAGTYKHICPSCFEEIVFEVPLITF